MKKWVIFWGLGFSGMAALIYEIHWTREISLVIGSTTYALSTVLAAFLSGLAAGAFIGGKMSEKRDPYSFDAPPCRREYSFQNLVVSKREMFNPHRMISFFT